MIQASQQLIDHLATATEFHMTDLLTITTRAGNVIRATSLDIDLTVDGHFYSSDLLKYSRSIITVQAGLEVDALELTFYPDAATLIGSVPFVQAVSMGALDAATVLLDRAWFDATTWALIGKIHRFQGRVSDIQDFTRSEVPVTVKSDLELLNIKMPRNVYQPGCRHTLFDTGCSLTKSGYAVGSSVLSGSTRTLLLCGLTQAGASAGTWQNFYIGTGDGIYSEPETNGWATPPPTGTSVFTATLPDIPDSVLAVYVAGVAVSGWQWSNVSGTSISITLAEIPVTGAEIYADITYKQSSWFGLGTVTFTSGANSGVSRTVKEYSPGRISFSLPLPYAPGIGDTFTAYAGCDKQMRTCDGKFANLANFSGEPFVPAPEAAY
jgi:hypothetical protein